MSGNDALLKKLPRIIRLIPIVLIIVGANCSFSGDERVSINFSNLKTERFLLPGTSDMLLQHFSRLDSPFRIDSATVHHASVNMTLYSRNHAKDRFEVVLGDPERRCSGKVAGPWCVVFPDRRPPDSVVAAIVPFLGDWPHRSPWFVLDDNDVVSHWGRRMPPVFRELAVEGWHVESVTNASSDNTSPVVIRLAKPESDLELPVWWILKTDFPQSLCIFRTKNLCVGAPAGFDAHSLPEDARQAVESLGRELVSMDRIGFDTGVREKVLRGVLLAVFLALTAITAWLLAGISYRSPPPRWAAWSLAALMAGAFVLRMTLSPWGMLHEFHHASSYFGGLLFDNSLQHLGSETGPAIYRAVNWLFGGEEQAIFAFNAVLATLTILAVVLMDYALFRKWPRALFAGLLLAVLPQHLRYSGSEVLFIPSMLFFLWTGALLIHYLDSRRLVVALAAVFALFLATQTRPEMLLTPFLCALIIVFARSENKLRILIEWRTVLVVAVLASLFMIKHLYSETSVGLPPHFPNLDINLLDIKWIDIRITPVVLWLFWSAGFVWGLKFQTGATLWLVFSAAVFTLGSLLIFENELYDIRSQLLSVPFHVMVAAGSVQVILSCRQVLRWTWIPLMATVLTLPVLGLANRSDFVTEEMASQQEWGFIQDTVSQLPDGLGWELLAELQTEAPFPVDLLWRHGKLLKPRDLRILSELQEMPDPGIGLVFYQGLYCYVSRQGETTKPMRPYCADMFSSYELRAVATRILHGRGDPDMNYTVGNRGPFNVGFYVVLGPRRAESPHDRNIGE